MKATSQLRTIKTNFGALQYTLIYKKTDNISLHIEKNKSIFMSMPYGVDETVGDRFILEKQDDIYNNLAKLSLMVTSLEKHYTTGDTFFYLGGILTLEVVEDSADMVVNKENILYLHTKELEDVKKNKKLVDKWFSKKRRSVFTKINNETYEKFRAYKTPKAELRIEHMTDKWGSCQPNRGIITLNAQLLDIPREAIEYVMVHEYAHLVHWDHSQNFHKVVAAVMPNWEVCKQKLELSDFNKSF